MRCGSCRYGACNHSDEAVGSGLIRAQYGISVVQEL
jgi:hypothetical protein